MRIFGIAILVAVASANASAATFSVIYTPQGGQGGYPMVGALRGGVVYGVDPKAGAAGAGTLFRLTEAGSYTVLYSFTGGADGSTPNARLAFDKSGNMYGTTQAGGSAGAGTVFELPKGSSTLRTLYTFLGAPDGATPLDGLAIDPQGTLFGTTSDGDISPGNGEIFSISPGGAMTTIYRFQSGADGHCPFTGVILGLHGNLYGTVVGYGFGGQPQGALFDFSRTKQTVQTLYSFTNGTDGDYPMITPSRDKSGNLFDVSNLQNGQTYAGSIWSYTLAGGAPHTFRIIHALNGNTDGYSPNSPLVLGSDGDFYGTTSNGGVGYGTVFQVTPSGNFTVLHSFTGGADGTSPTGRLAADNSGRLFGGTASGTVFEIQP